MIRLLVVALGLVFASRVVALEVTDVAGRTVTLDGPSETIVLGDGRVLTALALLDRDNPVARVKYILSDLGRTDPDMLSHLKARFPETADIPMVVGTETGASAEAIIALGPDVAILSMSGHGPSVEDKEFVSQLEAAGIPVVFIDFRMDPLNNTTASIRLMGEVLGRSAEADEYIRFYDARKALIEERVAGMDARRPTVFLQAHVGRMPCCVGMASGMLGPFVGVAGGENISARVAPGPVGRHTLEFLLTENPDVWIGTASGSVAELDGGMPVMVLGLGVDEALARKAARAAVPAAGIESLSAVTTGRAHAIWHGFYNSPFNIYALESFAKWIHPDLFADLDPEATMQEIHRRFFPLESPGLYAVSVDE
ncbi:ABC transporter substrate-binding protein [Polymorphum gilvum]|uniref:ABC-type Fe3+-hydroxamate transport system periplasmic component-like protein n=1 Tax=Polymorphum gilvum (strain LMG 25793 / CGMCC 1.9160 / SL003B-26A1) TaxID=991905 RepID=F2IYX4_POLGS|nr:ABC transporter substrate-binding protein [Polymorphum gilvum]ADZ70589.1 ABC-type Fe3+-hydroxamate transport system periplasmic component-like protein [Polymorphum gilvum SL003B-26A1]